MYMYVYRRKNVHSGQNNCKTRKTITIYRGDKIQDLETIYIQATLSSHFREPAPSLSRENLKKRFSRLLSLHYRLFVSQT